MLVLSSLANTGTSPLTRFYGTQKNRVKGKQRYSRTVLVLKWENGTFELPKSTICAKVTTYTYQVS